MIIELKPVLGNKTKETFVDNGYIKMTFTDKALIIRTFYKYNKLVDDQDESMGFKLSIVNEKCFALKSQISFVGVAYDLDEDINFVTWKKGSFINCESAEQANDLFNKITNWLLTD